MRSPKGGTHAVRVVVVDVAAADELGLRGRVEYHVGLVHLRRGAAAAWRAAHGRSVAAAGVVARIIEGVARKHIGASEPKSEL